LWEDEMKRMFAEKGYDRDAFEYFTKAAERHRGFLERNAFLWGRGFPRINTDGSKGSN